VHPDNRGLGPAQAVRIVELARESAPAVALAAARRALEAPDLPAPTRAKLEQQLGALEGAAAAAPPAPERKREAPPASAATKPAAPAAAKADRSIELDLDPAYEVPLAPAEAAGSALAARFSDVKAAEAVPSALDETALALVLGDGRAARLELAKIQGIAVGTVGGLGPKPVILVDLLLNHDDVSEGPLRVVRLRSDRFDPRRLAPGATPLDAFHAFLNELATRTNAALLPDPESFRGGALSKYADVEAWQRQVLKVG
jgi:hypothetical protein